MKPRRFHNWWSTGVLAGTFFLAMFAGWTPLGTQIDHDVYDWMFRLIRPHAGPAKCAVVGIDDESLRQTGGVRRLRTTVADVLDSVSAARPSVIAVDIGLSDVGDPAEDARLEESIRKAGRVVLSTDLTSAAREWQDPLPRFAQWASGVGHAHAEPDPVSREILLYKASGRQRRWALSVESLRVALKADVVEESLNDVTVGGIRIPARIRDDRAVRIRYRPPEDDVPEISWIALRDHPQLSAKLAGKAVFIGVTSQTAVKDRLQTPYSNRDTVPGVRIHASVYETLAGGRFLNDVPDGIVLLVCAAIVASAGICFAWLSGWQAYGAATLILALCHIAPFVLFPAYIFPYTPPVFSAWLSISAAATFQHFVVRSGLRKAEGERKRYQEAMHFVVHEMRTPLTAIQGSSELIGRYNLSEDKRKEIASLINSESKRLGRMIKIFLDVERLSAGQMEIKKEPFDGEALMQACVNRVRPLAERKQIRIQLRPMADIQLVGDTELMDYAFYNLLTNAVKYSPAETEVDVFAERRGDEIHISVKDQGIGLDQKEIKQIFQKFYRTHSAEASGEAGTGIGLSIVEQIIVQHGGRIDVQSSPGRGSCFTLVLPACATLPASA
jgi:signal transduction histidine kinase